MTRPPMKLATALVIGIALFAASSAHADPTTECNDSGTGGTECGTNSTAADFATAIGTDATASGEGSVAVGSSATASGFVAVAIGNAALASGDNSTATGFLAQATANGATANGAGALAEGENSVAVGINANATVDATNSVALGANSVADQPNTVSVGAAGDERRIVNVAAGIDPTDAVNVGQLSATNTAIATANTAIANETTARVAGDAALGVRIDDLTFDLNEGLRDNARDARAGTSAALAAAALPQAMDPGRTMVSGGVGTYRGRTAFAVGASHRLSTGSTVLKVGVTYDSTEHVGAHAGFGVQF